MSGLEVFDSLKYRVEVCEDGTRQHFNAKGLLHREDGPAIETNNSARLLYLHGVKL